MTIFELLLGFILIHIACTPFRRWAGKQEQSKYLVSQITKEEYKKMEKEVLEMLVERENR